MGVVRDLYDKVSQTGGRDVKDVINVQANYEDRFQGTVFEITSVLEKSQSELEHKKNQITRCSAF